MSSSVRFFITPNELDNEYLIPYFKKESISINGVSISSNQIKKINVSSTFIRDDEFYLYGLKLGYDFSDNISIQGKTKFFKSCKDETNTFIKTSSVYSSNNGILKNKTTNYVDKNRIIELKSIGRKSNLRLCSNRMSHLSIDDL